MGTIGVACKICFTTLLVWSTALMSSFAMMAIVDELWLGVDLQSACMVRPICFGFMLVGFMQRGHLVSFPIVSARMPPQI